MFGGVGFYAAGIFFGFLAADELYFKVDDQTRSRYEKQGMTPFLAPGESMSSYYRVPGTVVEDLDEFRSWVLESVECAGRSKGRARSPAFRRR